MTLRHAGATEYNATKVWLDNNNENRPDATFTLWRYSTNGGTPATASQVSVSSLQSEGSSGETKETDYISITVSPNDGDFC